MSKKKKIILGLILAVVLAAGGFAVGRAGTSTEDKKLSSIQMLIDQYFLEDTAETDFESGIYKGYVNQLGDPYSVYYTKEEYEDLVEDDSGHYQGIGVVVSQNIQTNEVTVTRVFDDGPAAQAGVQQYDVIRKVDGTSVANMELSEVVDLIRTGSSETVELTLYRDGEEVVVNSKRSDVEAQMVDYEMLDDGIGYIALYEFIETTYDQFHNAYADLESQGMKSLIIDLRSNPGGLLEQVQKVSDDLIPAGSVIVSTEDKQGNKEYLKAETDSEITIPLVVLVDGYSASASEILAGVIKDYKIGTLLGQKTYGKGIVQRIFPLSDGSAVKLTISKYFTPNGDYIHDKGIEPDIEMEENYIAKNGDTLADDTWVQEAIKELKKQMKE
ncbi:MAG: S41 family peptidase [Lachnospiraceae bacterium]|nr:S41 family peptidase [Lachnospiraceae bacterium]